MSEFNRRQVGNHRRLGGKGFTLIELLVVIAIIAIVAAILFPVFAEVKASAKKAACLSNLEQIGFAYSMYKTDYDDLNPDRRDLKSSFPGGYLPWKGWPPVDPRSAWAAVIFGPYIHESQIWTCPMLSSGPLSSEPRVVQSVSAAPNAPVTRYWMWRFARIDNPVPLAYVWGKSDEQMIADLQLAKDPTVGFPNSDSDVELAVDPYFPDNIATVPPALLGISVHHGGRNRLYFDEHTKFVPDGRLDR